MAEPNPHMAKRLEEKASRLDRRTTVVPRAAEDLPFPEESFDSVVSSLVLCSVSDLNATLASVRRVLRNGLAPRNESHGETDIKIGRPVVRNDSVGIEVL